MGKKVKSEKEIRDKLPKVLSCYKDSDFAVQQKARFVYHLMIAALVAVFLLLFSTAYVQLNSVEYSGIYLPILLPEILLLILFGLCLILLIKGHITIASNLFIIFSMICVWYIMWTGKGNVVARLDTIVFIIALISLTPLFIEKFKLTVFIYIVTNIILLVIGFISRY